VLAELGIDDRVLLWNVVPTHPGTASSNRRPTRAEIGAGQRYALAVMAGRRVVAVGRLAEEMCRGLAVRYPSHGGARAFHAGLVELLDRGDVLPGPA
jgi:hypothetical protein